MSLAEYLKEAAAREWTPGVHDCTAWPARWAGIAVPVYQSDEEGQARIAEAGGLVPLWDAAIGDRFARTSAPAAGDVGVIVAVGAGGAQTEVGAIFTGRRWAFPSPIRGLVCASAEAVAAWSVGCPSR